MATLYFRVTAVSIYCNLVFKSCLDTILAVELVIIIKLTFYISKFLQHLLSLMTMRVRLFESIIGGLVETNLDFSDIDL